MSDEWIKKLKAGDKVYVKMSGINRGTLYCTTVKRITPKVMSEPRRTVFLEVDIEE